MEIGFCTFVGMFFDLLPTFKFIFHVKIQLFVTHKSYQDPDPVRLDPHWFGFLDPYPDPHRDKNLDPYPH